MRARRRALGFVDAVVAERNFANAVDAALAGEMERRGGGTAAAALNLYPARKAMAIQMRKQTEEQGAQRALSRALCADRPVGNSTAVRWSDMLEAEHASFAQLLPTETTQNLIRVFFLRERLQAERQGRLRRSRMSMSSARARWAADIARMVRAARAWASPSRTPAARHWARRSPSAHKLFDRKLRDARTAARARPLDARPARRGRAPRRPDHRGRAREAGAEAKRSMRRSRRRRSRTR